MLNCLLRLETTIDPAAFAITGPPMSAGLVSMMLTWLASGSCNPIFLRAADRFAQIASADAFQARSCAIRLHDQCRLFCGQLLDLVAVLDRAEMLPHVHHHEQ